MYKSLCPNKLIMHSSIYTHPFVHVHRMRNKQNVEDPLEVVVVVVETSHQQQLFLRNNGILCPLGVFIRLRVPQSTIN